MNKLKDTAVQERKQSSFFLSALPFFIVAHCVHHLLTSLPQPLLPFIRAEFNLSYTQSAFVISAFSLSNAFSQLPSGFLADRIGTRSLITIGIVGVAIAGLMVGLSQTYVMMLVFLMFMGLTAGGYHPAATPMISSAWPGTWVSFNWRSRSTFSNAGYSRCYCKCEYFRPELAWHISGTGHSHGHIWYIFLLFHETAS